MKRIALALILLLAMTQAASSKEPRRMVFFFFVTGMPTATHTREELQEMQKAHLANMDRLYKEGLLKLAGPCADPDKRRRGIVLIDVAAEKDLDKHFAADPFIQHGRMKMEPFKVRVETLDVGMPEDGITRHTIALVQGESDKDKTRFDLKSLKSLPEDQRPPIVLTATEPGAIRAVLIFGSAKPDEVQSRLRELPQMRDKKLTAVAFGQWMGKGMLKSGE